MSKMIALTGIGCVARLPAWRPGAALFVLGTFLLPAEPPRRIEFAFKPVDIDSAHRRRATSQDTLLASVEALRRSNPGFRLGNCNLNDRWRRNGPPCLSRGQAPGRLRERIRRTKILMTSVI